MNVKCRRMKVVVVENGTHPHVKTAVADIGHLAKEFSTRPSVKKLSDSVIVIFDKDFLSKNKLSLDYVKIIFCGITPSNNLCSLTLSEQERYMNFFTENSDILEFFFGLKTLPDFTK